MSTMQKVENLVSRQLEADDAVFFLDEVHALYVNDSFCGYTVIFSHEQLPHKYEALLVSRNTTSFGVSVEGAGRFNCILYFDSEIAQFQRKTPVLRC